MGVGAVRLHPHRVRLRVPAYQDVRLLEPDPADEVLFRQATAIVTERQSADSASWKNVVVKRERVKRKFG